MRVLRHGGVVLPFVLVLVGCVDSRVDEPAAGNAGSAGSSSETGGTGGVFVEQGPWEECYLENGRRCIPDHVLARHGVAYSGYRTGQSPNIEAYPSVEEIKQDLELLLEGGWTLIRLFDSGTHAERVLQVIVENGFDFKVQLGIWIDGPVATKDAENRADLERGVALANLYPSTIVSVSVGNEVLDDWSSVRTPPDELAAYISEVRERVVQPVATDDMYPPFMMNNQYVDVQQVVEAIDYISLHGYAFLDAPWNNWDWWQDRYPEGPERALAMMNAAFDYQKTIVKNVRTALADKGLDMPINIGEAGWKSVSTKISQPIELNLAHPVNQKMFYDRLFDWVYGASRDADSPGTMLYFASFDEPWKGIDDGWGLFDTNRQPKYVIWDLLPARKPVDAPVYTEADAVYYKAP
jgi:exo-beta-1,3-glucanase (GH17 family)